MSLGIRRAFLFIALVASSSSSCFALDQCKDVLRDGVFQHYTDKSNYYYTMIRDLNFAQKTFQEAKTDKSFDGDIPIGDLVLGVGFSEAQFNQKKTEINNRFSTSITTAKTLDMAITSGDPKIIGAWTQCMERRGGLTLTYEVDDSLSVRATLQWYAPNGGGQGAVALTEDISLPPNVDKDNSNLACFKKGRILSVGAPCTAVLRLKDAKPSMVLLAQAVYNGSPVGDASAYLPPRLKPTIETIPFDFKSSPECSDFKNSNVYILNNVVSAHKSCSIGDMARDGWTFDLGSLRIVSTQRSNAGKDSKCRLDTDDQTPFLLGYTNNAYSAVAGTQSCDVTANVNIRREQWLPY